MSIVTPLKSPNNFICAEALKNIISKDSKIDSFGFSSGQLELSLLRDGYDITFFTNKLFVWEFWLHLKTNHVNFIDDVRSIHESLNFNDLVNIKQNWTKLFDETEFRAALFYLLNRYSSNGVFSRNEIIKTNFSPLNLRQLDMVAPLIKNADFRYHKHEDLCDFIQDLEGDNLYMIPATEYKYRVLMGNYVPNQEEVYFNHERIFNILNDSDKKILAIYKYNDYVDQMYKNKIYVDKSGKITNNKKIAEEIVFNNFGL